VGLERTCDIWGCEMISKATLTVMVMFFLHGIGNAQRGSLEKTIDFETYKAVKEIVFSRDVVTARHSHFYLILEFANYSNPDSQVVIMRTFDKVEIVEYSLEKNLWVQLEEILKVTGSTEPIDLASRVEVKKRILKSSEEELAGWHRELSRNLSRTIRKLRKRNKEYDTLEGAQLLNPNATIYKLIYKDIDGELVFELKDLEVDKIHTSGSFPLSQWMNKVRLDIEKRQN
jgi:hypothetical protein